MQVHVEVPGPLNRVWAAIATAEGISTWFVPTTFEMDASGTPQQIRFSFSPDSIDVVNVGEWRPPEGFVAESSNFIPGGPLVTTEWNVREGCGGSCIVRVEHQLVADSDRWDSYLEGAESGWPAFFENLRAYLA